MNLIAFAVASEQLQTSRNSVFLDARNDLFVSDWLVSDRRRSNQSAAFDERWPSTVAASHSHVSARTWPDSALCPFERGIFTSLHPSILHRLLHFCSFSRASVSSAELRQSIDKAARFQ